MDFGHRRCTSWILWSLNLDKLQNFILFLVLCRQLLVEEKEGLVGDIAFLQVKMGLLVVVFHVILQCKDMVAFKTGVFFLPPLRSSLASRLPSLARGGEWYLERRRSRKILTGSRNLGSVFDKSRSLVFAWFVFTFFESRNFLPKSLGLGFLTRVSASRRVSDFTIRHPSCLKNNKPPFLQACCLSYSISLCRMLWQSVWIYAILLISRDLS